jgi:hypothetical protein
MRILERAEHSVGVHLELAAIALDQLREGILVSSSRRANELLDFGRRRRPLLSIAVPTPS